MSRLTLDKQMMKDKREKSTIWGVPIKTKGKKDENSKKIEAIIQKILNNQKLTEDEALLLKLRILGDWTISEKNVDGIRYLVAIYYYLEKQTIIAIYEVDSSNKESVPSIIDIVEEKKIHGKNRFKWADGQLLTTVPTIKNCYVGQTIEELHKTFGHPQRIFFK